MNAYRITFVNPAFAPRASYEVVRATDETEAVRRFWERTNPAAVIRSIGDNGIVLVERIGRRGGAA